MIKNQRQYRITKSQLAKFEAALSEAAARPDVDPRLRSLEEDALRSQLEELRGTSSDVKKIHAAQDKCQELGNNVRNSRETAAEAQGMMKATEHMIATLDLEEPDTQLRTTVFDNVPLEEVRP